MRTRRHFGSIVEDPRRHGFYVKFTLEGRPYHRFAGPTLELAEKKLSQIHVMVCDLQPAGEIMAKVFGDLHGSTVTFREAVPHYLQSAGFRKRTTTQFTDDRHYRVINKAAWSNKMLAAVKPADIEQWISDQVREELAPGTINRRLSLASVLFKWAVRMGHLKDTPLRNVQRLSEKGRARETYLTAGEARALVECATPHFRPTLVTALSTGMRRGEIVKLQWDCVDFERKEIVIRPETEKAGRGRVIPMTNALLAELKALKARTTVTPITGTSPVFLQVRPCLIKGFRPQRNTSIRSSLNRAVRLCSAIPPEKKPKIGMHCLRHTAASLMAAAGVPIFDIAKILGHSQISVTMRYAHFAPECGRAAIAKLGKMLDLPEPPAPPASATGTA